MEFFDRVVVGVDGSEFGLEALHRALASRSPGGALKAVMALHEGRQRLPDSAGLPPQAHSSVAVVWTSEGSDCEIRSALGAAET